MQMIRIAHIFGALALAAVIGSSAQATDEGLKASIIEAQDSLMSLPLTEKLTAEFRSDKTTMVYRESDVGRTDARPVAIQFQGDVLLQVGNVQLASNWMLFDSADRSLTAAEVSLVQGSTRQSVSYSCSSGQLFINGEGTGTYPTDSNPRMDLIPGAAVSCNGNMIRAVFIVR